MPKLAKSLNAKINTKIKNLPNSAIRSFNQRISTIPGIIKLTIGEPDLNTPEHIKQAAINDITNDDSHYAPEAGKKKYLKAVSKYLNQSLGVNYDPATELCATVGVSEGLNIAAMA
ncbi:MAG: aminotransferase class I/II-fold pyridoxal phosphate-dependent enzyme, partial [Lactobacillus sp.]|nr:aminotransferase class I/II-fold pyridoxal phosphate-dependent enzyme [Lactobacillus sp.]